MSAGWEKILFKVVLYGIVAAQAFLVYIAWGEWNVPPWMHLGLFGFGFTIPQAVGFCLVGIEAWALVVRDIAEAHGQKKKAGWLLVGFVFTFALNGVMDWTGWYSVFGGDQTTRSQAAQTYQLRHDEYTDALQEAEAAIARIVGTEQAPRADAPRAESVIRAELASQDTDDRRWREQRIGDLPRRYVDKRARLEAELEERLALDAARVSRRDARASLRTLGAPPSEESASLGAINGLLQPFGTQIDSRGLNAFYAFGLMIAMKFWIGVGFWASSFHAAGGRRRHARPRIDLGGVRDMAEGFLSRIRPRAPDNPAQEPEPVIIDEPTAPPAKIIAHPAAKARAPVAKRRSSDGRGWGPPQRRQR